METISNNFSKITFDTSLSNNKSTSNPSFILERPFDIINGFQVGKFVGINSITNIRDTNNKISLTTYNGTAANVCASTIPVGNYTIDSFTPVLLNTLNTASGSTFGVSLNTMENVYIISNTNGSFCFNSVNNNVYYEIGIVDAQLNIPSSKLIAGSSYDLSGLKQVNVVSSDFGVRCCQKIGSNLNTILSIPIEIPFNGVITSPESNVCLNTAVYNKSDFTFSLYDERNRPITGLKDWVLEVYIRTS